MQVKMIRPTIIARQYIIVAISTGCYGWTGFGAGIGRGAYTGYIGGGCTYYC